MSSEQIAENDAQRRRAVADHLGKHFRSSHTRRADEAAPLQPASRANAEAVAEREPPRPELAPGQAEVDRHLRGIDKARPMSGVPSHGGLRGITP